MQIKSTVKGDKEIIANIRRAYRSVGGNFLDNTLRTALEPMKLETEANARRLRDFDGKYPGWPPPTTPRPGGHLDEGMKIARTSSKNPYEKEYWLAFGKRGRKLAHLVEFGTLPHFQPKRGVMHPGATPHPFFRPAFEGTKTGTLETVSHRIWTQINNSLIGSFR